MRTVLGCPFHRGWAEEPMGRDVGDCLFRTRVYTCFRTVRTSRVAPPRRNVVSYGKGCHQMDVRKQEAYIGTWSQGAPALLDSSTESQRRQFQAGVTRRARWPQADRMMLPARQAGTVNVASKRCAHQGCTTRMSHGVDDGSKKADSCCQHTQATEWRTSIARAVPAKAAPSVNRHAA